MKNSYLLLQTSTVDSVISDLLSATEEGYTWGSTVGIGLTACLLAIALIQFLFNRN